MALYELVFNFNFNFNEVDHGLLLCTFADSRFGKAAFVQICKTYTVSRKQGLSTGKVISLADASPLYK